MGSNQSSSARINLLAPPEEEEEENNTFSDGESTDVNGELGGDNGDKEEKEKVQEQVGEKEKEINFVPSCPVCMETWTSEGPHRVCCIPCGHVYGRSCLEKWLNQCGNIVGKCPQCNIKFKPTDIINLFALRIPEPNDDLQKGSGTESIDALNSQIANLKSLLENQQEVFKKLDKRLDGLQIDFESRLDQLREELLTDFQSRSDQLRDELHVDIESRIDELFVQLESRLDQLVNIKVDEKMAELKIKLDEKQAQLDQLICQYQQGQIACSHESANELAIAALNVVATRDENGPVGSEDFGS